VADLRKSQAEWTRFLGREVVGMFLASLSELQAFEDRYSKQRIAVWVQNDVNANHRPGSVHLRGVNLGVNTSPEGLLYVRITGATNPRTVSVYRAPGGAAQHLVARGRGDAGADVTLAEQKASGLSGTWGLSPSVTVDVSDLLRVFPVPDWRVRMKTVWDGSVAKDVRSQSDFLEALDAVALRIRDARLIVLEAFAAFATRPGSRGADFLGVSNSALAAEGPLRDPSGAIGRRRTGFLVDLARAMEADTVAGPQSVARRQVKAQAAVFASTNRGQGQVAAHAPREFCPAARWTFRCVRGQETGHGGREEFQCAVKVVGEDRQINFGGVRIKQSFAGPEGIGPFVLERAYTKAGDPGDQTLGPVAAITTTGERAGNTEAGLLHWRAEKRGAVWDVSFFRSASRAVGDLVAKAEGIAPGAAFQAAERNASGLGLTWQLGPQPQTTSGTVDCNFFRVEGPSGVPDEFVIETFVADEGAIQGLLARHIGGHLASKVVGQETIPDALIRAGNPLSLLEP